MASVKGGDEDDDDDDAIDDDAIEEDDELGKAVGEDGGIGSVGGGVGRLARSLTLLTIFCIQLSRCCHAVNLFFRILILE